MSGIRKNQLDRSVFTKAEYDNGNSGSSINIDWENGSFQRVVLDSSAPSITFSNMETGKAYVLKVVQDTDGARNPVLPSNVRWPNGTAPVFTQLRDAIDIITLIYDGSDFDATITKNFTYNQNYFGDGSDGTLSTSANVNLPSTTDGDVVVKKYNNLTINLGHTMTVANRCKGLVVYVKGDCVINGTLTMTARGAFADPVAAGVSASGIRFIRLKSGGVDTLSSSDVAGCGSGLIASEANQRSISNNGSIYTVSRFGGSGGAGKSGTGSGNNGGVVSNGMGGGGGGGANLATGGQGASATCFSGGSGGGGADRTGNGGNGSAYGGQGGAGVAAVDNSSYGAGGGAGNPGGARGGQSYPYPGETGTGGLLVLIVGGNLTIGPSGVISSNGMAGGGGYAGGGGSGGGRIIALRAGSYSNSGTIQANGGRSYAYSPSTGSEGGAGSITIDSIDP